MSELNNKIADLERKIAGYEAEYESDKSPELRRLIASSQDTLTELLRQRNFTSAPAPPTDLQKFLFKESLRQSSSLFPENHFGQYVLRRDRVINEVKSKIKTLIDLKSVPSIYLSGCLGSGKTSLLLLLARYFKAEGYEVYFFKSASDIPPGCSPYFDNLLMDMSKKVAVLIDEVTSNPNSGLFTTLLKSASCNLVVIGAAVPVEIPTGLAATFNRIFTMPELNLRENDEDFLELVQYCVKLNVTTPELTKSICDHILAQCGGHSYPTLAFIEHFFTLKENQMYLSSMRDFCRYFYGPDFGNSLVYLKVRNRCFAQFTNRNILEMGFRVLSGNETSTDILELTRLGWWNPSTNDFISKFLMNACLSKVIPPRKGVPIYLEKEAPPEENTKLVIVKGLEGMMESDFRCWNHESEVNVENGISFNWAHRVKEKIPNAYLSFQERGNSGVVDFYLNGLADTAIEVLLNATQTVDPKTKGQSQDIDEHLQRFRSDQYYWKTHVLFNFSMKSDRVVLPRDETAHNKVYTYVYPTNTLYRGNELLCSPAIPKLSGGSRPFGMGQNRSFSTQHLKGLPALGSRRFFLSVNKVFSFIKR